MWVSQMLTHSLLIGITLEDMDALFAKPVYKTVWAQMRGKPVLEGNAANRSDSPFDEDDEKARELRIP
jgi:hypothetical protein